MATDRCLTIASAEEKRRSRTTVLDAQNLLRHSLRFGLQWKEKPTMPRLCDGQFGLGRRGDADRAWTFPVAKGAAQKRRGAAFSAENDDILMQCQFPVPRHKGDAARRNLCQDPVIGCLLLDSTYARKCWCCCHWCSYFLAAFGAAVFDTQSPTAHWMPALRKMWSFLCFQCARETEGVDLAKRCNDWALKRENIFSFK